jgi:hypothetical protein
MSSSSAQAAALEEWITLLGEGRNSTYAYSMLHRFPTIVRACAYPSTASALTFVAYDIILTFGQEVSGSLIIQLDVVLMRWADEVYMGVWVVRSKSVVHNGSILWSHQSHVCPSFVSCES